MSNNDDDKLGQQATEKRPTIRENNNNNTDETKDKVHKHQTSSSSESTSKDRGQRSRRSNYDPEAQQPNYRHSNSNSEENQDAFFEGDQECSWKTGLLTCALVTLGVVAVFVTVGLFSELHVPDPKESGKSTAERNYQAEQDALGTFNITDIDDPLTCLCQITSSTQGQPCGPTTDDNPEALSRVYCQQGEACVVRTTRNEGGLLFNGSDRGCGRIPRLVEGRSCRVKHGVDGELISECYCTRSNCNRGTCDCWNGRNGYPNELTAFLFGR